MRANTRNDLIGERIKLERKRLGYSQEKFAQLCGASARSMVGWEQKRTCPSSTVLAEWANHGIDVLYILTGSRSQNLIVHVSGAGTTIRFPRPNGSLLLHWLDGSLMVQAYAPTLASKAVSDSATCYVDGSGLHVGSSIFPLSEYEQHFLTIALAPDPKESDLIKLAGELKEVAAERNEEPKRFFEEMFG